MRSRFNVLMLVAAFGLQAPTEVCAADVEGQPLGANILRVMQVLEFLGAPLTVDETVALQQAATDRDPAALQKLLDPHVLCTVHINPELRVKAARGDAKAILHQGGYTPVLIKVDNEGTVTERLRITSPQAGKVYGGVSDAILKRQAQTELGQDQTDDPKSGRFLDVEVFTAAPMTEKLSGLEVEYVIALIDSSEAGKREATLVFDVGQGTQDLGFRSELPVLFDVHPAIPLKLSVKEDGVPSIARLTFRDRQGRVYPPQGKRLAPDFFFQPHVYRADGETVLLPAGSYTMTSCRGPEYREVTRDIAVSASNNASIDVPLERWIDPARRGWFSGDHHIHGAGCSHYQSPTQGVSPADMFRQVKGEALNVGCVLTWGPCYDFQRRYFSPDADLVTEPLTVLKYDVEVSGFGSQSLGHVCLLNLVDQTYPGSEGTSIKGWPTWTVPVMKWAKEQGGVTGYPHSDLRTDPAVSAKWLMARNDQDRDGQLTAAEINNAVLPEAFEKLDADRNQSVSLAELTAGGERAANELPNLLIPSMTGGGAMEIVVSTPEGVCDFISAMDTSRVGEWNTWYHLMNCGFPLKVSGETDFPCMSSRRVGQGRVYVRLADGPLSKVNFGDWCRGIAAGRSYVSDGYAHALDYRVNGVAPGFGHVTADAPLTVKVAAVVAFAQETPEGVAYGTQDAPEGRRVSGDTVTLHQPRSQKLVPGGERLVEVVVNGAVAGQATVPADGKEHALSFDVPIQQSSWVALRQFPQMHTNPVEVLIGGKAIRASRKSAQWCRTAIDLLWENRSKFISDAEKPAAREAYDRAIKTYERLAGEAGEGT
ncbi:MAG: CehA/McbA family metallohydrolase [Planctomycetaceae bacterium]